MAQAQGWVKTGTRLRYSPLPWPLIRIGALLMPIWAALLEMRYLWDTAHALDNRKLEALIGPEPHTPLPQAVCMSLHDLGFIKATEA